MAITNVPEGDASRLRARRASTECGVHGCKDWLSTRVLRPWRPIRLNRSSPCQESACLSRDAVVNARLGIGATPCSYEEASLSSLRLVRFAFYVLCGNEAELATKTTPSRRHRRIHRDNTYRPPALRHIAPSSLLFTLFTHPTTPVAWKFITDKPDFARDLTRQAKRHCSLLTQPHGFGSVSGARAHLQRGLKLAAWALAKHRW